ncbi:MAG: hypothetical protein JXR37_08855 [Kiritimatiellae bacterium]|nr:hypothetical protein [Kiritimatiellia bacterium]
MYRKRGKSKTLHAVLAAAMVVLAAPVHRALAEPSFDDQFDAPPLDPAWQVMEGLGSYSLESNPGHLRYILEGPRANGGGWRPVDIGTWSPSLALLRPFEGDTWSIRTKATFNYKWQGTGAQDQQLYIAFGDGTQDFIIIQRTADQGYNHNGLHAHAVEDYQWVASNDSMKAADDTVENDWIHYTYWFEISRQGQEVTVDYSYDGVTFTNALSYTYTKPLPQDQIIAIAASVWATAGSYVDWDYMTLDAGDTVRVIAPERVAPGETFDLSVAARIDGLYGIQAIVGTDPSLLARQSVAYGDLFAGAETYYELPIQEETDTVLGAISLLRPANPMLGDGSLMDLTYRAADISVYEAADVLGPVDVACAAVAAGAEGVELPLAVFSTRIIIDDGIWGLNTIEGSVAFQNGSDFTGIEAQLWHDGVKYRSVLPDGAGHFAFPEVKANEYVIKAKGNRYVALPVALTVQEQANTVPIPEPMILYLGDVNRDGRIDIADVTIIAGAFNLTSDDPRYVADADLNGDGIINILDLSIVASHFDIGT